MSDEQITRDSLQIARLEEQFATMRRDITTMSEAMEAMEKQMAAVLERLSEARGGWRVLMLLGGAGAALGSSVSWLLSHVKFSP